MSCVVREFWKPLIVMAPKNLLQHKDCKSNLSEFDDVEGHPGFDKQGTRFKRLIKDHNDHKQVEEGINRLVLCSGKVYYELDEERKKSQRSDVAICRVEQLCPFHRLPVRSCAGADGAGKESIAARASSSP